MINRRRINSIIYLMIIILLTSGFLYSLFFPQIVYKYIGFLKIQNSKLVLQQGSSDCSVACVKMILDSQNIRIDYGLVNQELSPGKNGVEIKKILMVFKNHSLSPMPYETNTIGLRELGLPAIIYVRPDHFIVLRSITPEGDFLVDDPSSGSYKVSLIWMMIIYKGIAITILR